MFQQLFSLKKQKIHNTPLGRKQVLDIKMQLHTLPFPSPLRIENNSVLWSQGCLVKGVAIPFPMARAFQGKVLSPISGFPVTTGYSRQHWERCHAFSTDSSLNAAKERIGVCACANWARFWRTVQHNVPASAEYMRGLMVGGGCFSFTRGGKDKTNTPSLPLP